MQGRYYRPHAAALGRSASRLHGAQPHERAMPPPEPESASTPRWLGPFVLAAIVLGAVLRFAWPGDVEFKVDERWMLEHALAAGRTDAWPWSGMESSAILANPGASVWAFAALSRVFGLETPPALSMGVAACGVLALLVATWMAWHAVEADAREAWLWGVALAAVNPVAVTLQRKIWAQSLLPLLAVALWWCWLRRHRRGGAAAWGALGMVMGQIHLSGLVLVAALAGWTRWRAGGPRPAWSWWWAGTLVAALPLVPWAVEAVPALLTAAAERTAAAGGGGTLRGHPWWNAVVPRFWALWISEPVGPLVHSLGEHFPGYLRWPVVAGKPTWLMGAASLAAWGVLARGLWGGRRRLTEPARRGLDGTAALLGAALLPLGILLTLTTLTLYRHHLLAAFPLPLVWFSWIALGAGGRRARRWLAALLVANLFLSAGFLHYVHVHGGAPLGDYGVTWSTQSTEPSSPTKP